MINIEYDEVLEFHNYHYAGGNRYVQGDITIVVTDNGWSAYIKDTKACSSPFMSKLKELLNARYDKIE